MKQGDIGDFKQVIKGCQDLELVLLRHEFTKFKEDVEYLRAVDAELKERTKGGYGGS